MAFHRIIAAERLRGEARRPDAQKAEAPKGEIEDDSRGSDGAEKIGFTSLPITAASTKPNSGVERCASTIGRARRTTAA
jgi:hypothetical protein